MVQWERSRYKYLGTVGSVSWKSSKVRAVSFRRSLPWYFFHIPIWWRLNGNKSNKGKKSKGQRPFRLDTFWMHDNEFKEVLHKAWKGTAGRDFHAARMQMQSLAGDLQVCGRRNFGSIKEKIKKLKEEIRRY